MNQIIPIQSIAFKNITFGFPGDALLFEDTSVEFPKGKNIHITGSSGVGKSTLLKLLVGLVSPDKGQYLINDQDVSTLSFEEFLPYRLNIGFSFDLGGLLSNRTLFENMILPLEYHERVDLPGAKERALEIMRDFCIFQNRDLRPSNVTGGQRKACCVARAFVTKPEILILDQPNIGLDKIATDALISHIQKGRSEGWLKQVFIVTNDNSFTEKIGCEAYVVFERKIFSYQQFEKKVIFA